MYSITEPSTNLHYVDFQSLRWLRLFDRVSLMVIRDRVVLNNDDSSDPTVHNESLRRYTRRFHVGWRLNWHTRSDTSWYEPIYFLDLLFTVHRTEFPGSLYFYTHQNFEIIRCLFGLTPPKPPELLCFHATSVFIDLRYFSLEKIFSFILKSYIMLFSW